MRNRKFNKNNKNLKKNLKNTFMDSFQAKIGWKNVMDNSKKIAKKLKILKKYHYLWLHFNRK